MMRNILSFLTLLVVLLLAITNLAGAAGIDIVSQSYQFNTQWQESWTFTPANGDASSSGLTSGSYNISTNDTSLSAYSQSEPTGYASAQVQMDMLNFNFSSKAAVWVVSNTSEGFYKSGGGSKLDASAVAEWVFRPEYNDLTINLDHDLQFDYLAVEQNFQMELIDETSGNVLIEDVYGRGSTTSTYTSWVDPTHEYALIILGSSTNVDKKMVSMSAAATIDSVPEPATMLLLGLGLLGLAGVRRKIKK